MLSFFQMKLCQRALLRMRCLTVEVLGNSSQSIYARAMYGLARHSEGEGEGAWEVEFVCVR